MALLHHYKKSVRPYKCGPDFIDPQFHAKIAQTPSINLDGYMMNTTQLQWLFANYFDRDVAIVEGVMGYYDGMDKSASAYDVAESLGIASLLVIDASGSYITISAVLKGMLEFRSNNTIKAVVLNKCSSQMHYELVKKHIEKELEGLVVCGWIEKNLPALSSTHLGLNLKELEDERVALITQEVLKHIELDALESVMSMKVREVELYPFQKPLKRDEVCVVVKDSNFSFIYEDNINFLKESYAEVAFIDSTKDEPIPTNADIVILPGGYVESEEAYAKVKNSTAFRDSLRVHAKRGKKIYAECAGLIYLGKSIDEKEMSGILPIEFKLGAKRERLGYYKCEVESEVVKGHAFHYSCITSAPKTELKLYKVSKKSAKEGGFSVGNIYATYLHTMWRVNSFPTPLNSTTL